MSVPSSYAGASPIVNTATVSATSPTDGVPGNNSASASTTVLAASADLSITKTGPATVAAGGSIEYTITVTNAGPSDAAAVEVTDPDGPDLHVEHRQLHDRFPLRSRRRARRGRADDHGDLHRP
jgi:hypothetical protein